MDRRRSGRTGFAPEFAAAHSASVALDDGRLRLRVVLDGCCLEVFAQRGTAVLTDLVFPSADSRRLELAGPRAARVESLRVSRIGDPDSS